MEIKDMQQADMPLLGRKEITCEVSYVGVTPSRESVKDALAQKLNINKKLLVVQHIYTSFGGGSARILAHVYKDDGVMKEIESNAMLARNTGKQAEKPAKEPAAAPEEGPEHKPAEDEPDENVPEEKPSEDDKKPEGDE